MNKSCFVGAYAGLTVGFRGIHHPNIVQFMGLCKHESGTYLVTEFVAGTLRSVILGLGGLTTKHARDRRQPERLLGAKRSPVEDARAHGHGHRRRSELHAQEGPRVQVQNRPI